MSNETAYDETLVKYMKKLKSQMRRKRIRRTIIGVILGGALGFILAASGLTLATWQFWVICTINVATILNAGL